MKRSTVYFLAATLFSFATAGTTFAQDDSYYDPAKDPAKQNAQQNNTPTDYTDGYGSAESNESPAYKYDPRDNYTSQNSYNSNTYTDGGYYDEDYDSYFYTTRLHRYYRPNYGVNYYSYWFTPSFYYGFNTWNSYSYMSISFNPWYRDSWWSWNRPRTVVIYDPYYDPYWSYNWGWNSCSYYNNWNSWGHCGNYYNNFGWNGWGCNNGGFCGGYYSNGWGYGNGYNNGYWNGYNNGYYDGWNSAYGYGTGYNPYYYYYKNGTNNTSPATNNPPVVNNYPTVAKGNMPAAKPTGTITEVEIPREGVQRPINTAKPTGSLPTGSGVSVKTNPSAPYDYNTGNVVVASPGGVANGVKGSTKPTEMSKWDKTNGTLAQPQTNPWGYDNPNDAGGQKAAPQNTRPFVKEQQQPVQKNNDWNSAPPTNRGVDQPTRNVRRETEAEQQPNQPVQSSNNWNQQPNYGNRTPQREMNTSAPVQQRAEPKYNTAPVEQPRNNYREQPRQEVRPMEQPRQFSQPQTQPRNEIKSMDQPRGASLQQAPRQMEHRSSGGGVQSAPKGKRW